MGLGMEPRASVLGVTCQKEVLLYQRSSLRQQSLKWDLRRTIGGRQCYWADPRVEANMGGREYLVKSHECSELHRFIELCVWATRCQGVEIMYTKLTRIRGETADNQSISVFIQDTRIRRNLKTVL